MRTCYFLLKDIRDTSALLGINEWYDLCDTLLKKFDITSFYFGLPIRSRKMVMEGYRILLREFLPTSTDLSHKCYHVLLVDDDQWFADWLIEAFEDREFQLVQAAPHQVMDRLFLNDFDIVIVSMSLSNRMGFAIVEQIRQTQGLLTLPILAYTHIDTESHQKEILDMGIDILIHKAFSPRILELHLYHLLNRQKRLLYAEGVKSLPVQKMEMQALIEKEWVRFQRFHSFFSILMIKLDSSMVLAKKFDSKVVFDFVNDVQQLIMRSLRVYDEVRKWGPDTLFLLLPATRIEGAMLVAKRIIHLIRQHLNLGELTSHLFIAGIESELGYKDVNHMTIRLSQEFLRVSTSSQTYQIPSLIQSTEEKKFKKRLLLIDDDPVTPSIIQNHLKHEEWETKVCIGGNEAINLALSLQPDVIICESILKELDGFSFCTQIREFPQFKHTVFIFLSKQTLTKNVVRGIQAGADDYITKPFAVQELEARINRHLLNKQGRT